MRLWRTSEWPTLNGIGGELIDGRWHRVGAPITYLADSSALALLEVLVRKPRKTLPEPCQLLEIAASDDLAIVHWPTGRPLPERDATADWGSAFLRAGTASLARVPSAIAPHSWNYLLNPLHPDAARVTIRQAVRWPWDARLFGR